MASGLLSLKWNNHKSTFFHILSTIRSKESYCDATLACDGRFYPVHKLILSTCSEYFEEMFQRTQCKHPVIVLKDIRFEELDALLNYMYLGEVNVLQDKLAGLIKAAECLKIKGLAVPDEAPSGFRESKRGNREMGSPHPKRRRRDLHKSREMHSPEGRNEADASSTSNFESTSSRVKPSGASVGDTEKTEEFLPEEEAKEDCDRNSSRKPIAEIILDEMGVKTEPPDMPEQLEEVTDTKEELHAELNFGTEAQERVGGEEFSNEGSNNSNSAMAEGYTEDSYPEWDGDGSLQEYPAEGYSGENSDGTPMISSYSLKIESKAPVNVETERSVAQSSDWKRPTHSGIEATNLICPYCSKVWKDKWTLENHISSSYSLNIESMVDETERSVAQSLASREPTLDDAEVSNLICLHCSDVCRDKWTFENHVRVHTGEPFHCSLCPFSTKRIGSLCRHMGTHTGGHPYRC